MKAFQSTAVLGLMVALVVGYTFWDYRKASQPGGNVDGSGLQLFTFQNSQVTDLIVKSQAETIKIRRDQENWQLVEPIDDLADASSVEAFLYSLMIQKGKAFNDENVALDTGAEKAGAATIEWKNFGLEPPMVSIEVRTKKTNEALEISSKNAFDGSFYIRRDNKIYLGDQGLAQVATRTVDSFRSRQLWRKADVTVIGAEAVVNMDDLKSRFKIVNRDGLWTLDPAPTFEVDPDQVAKWLIRVQDLTAQEIVSEKPTLADKRQALVLNPSASIALKYTGPDGKAGDWVLSLGQDKAEETFIRSTERTTLYKTTNSALTLIRVPVEFFRSSKKAFKIPIEQAHRIALTVQGVPQVLVKDGSTWQVESSDGNLKLDTKKLETLLADISNLQAQEFVPSSRGNAFTPEHKIVVSDSKGELVFQIAWGGSYKGRYPYSRVVPLSFVRTNLESDVMAIPTSQMQSLIDSKLLVTKAKTP